MMCTRGRFAVALVVLSAFSLPGCATIAREPDTPLAVAFSDGSTGKCTFVSSRGAWSSRVPAADLVIEYSGEELLYDCETEDGRFSTGLYWDLGTEDLGGDRHHAFTRSVVIPVNPVESLSIREHALEPRIAQEH